MVFENYAASLGLRRKVPGLYKRLYQVQRSIIIERGETVIMKSELEIMDEKLFWLFRKASTSSMALQPLWALTAF
jgi:hypothetical protein